MPINSYREKLYYKKTKIFHTCLLEFSLWKKNSWNRGQELTGPIPLIIIITMISYTYLKRIKYFFAQQIKTVDFQLT